jgi:hypothetical protein
MGYEDEVKKALLGLEEDVKKEQAVSGDESKKEPVESEDDIKKEPVVSSNEGKKKPVERSKLVLIFFSSVFVISLLILVLFNFSGNQINNEGSGVLSVKTKTIVDVLREGETKKNHGEVWFHLREPIETIYNLTKDEDEYIYVWSPWRDLEAPEKGWLTLENGFYRINVNLDHSYYLLFDKISDIDVLVYNDEVEDPINILTGSDMGFADHGGDNPDSFASTAIHDLDGIGRYQIHWEEKDKGFLLVGLEGWDYLPEDPKRGFYIEGEALLGIFADKPYFIDATEINNIWNKFESYLPYKDPDEVIKSWVVVGKYDSLALKGGDMDHLNAETVWEPWYEVKNVYGQGRKPWHDGSATFSKMFPEHKIIGKKGNGGIIFSLPEGRFRFDESQGPFGDQIVGEFVLIVEEPVRAVSFTAEMVNEYNYFYDQESFSTEEYIDSMLSICEKYELVCPDRPLDWHDWKEKRFAYVISVVNDWYNPATNLPHDRIWEQADQGLADFETFEDIIYRQMESTEPLITRGL